MRRNIARDLCGLALTSLGVVAVVALGVLLGARADWTGVALLIGGTALLAAGVRLGRYDPTPRAPREAGLGDDRIEMRPVARGTGDAPIP